MAISEPAEASSGGDLSGSCVGAVSVGGSSLFGIVCRRTGRYTPCLMFVEDCARAVSGRPSSGGRGRRWKACGSRGEENRGAIESVGRSCSGSLSRSTSNCGAAPRHRSALRTRDGRWWMCWRVVKCRAHRYPFSPRKSAW